MSDVLVFDFSLSLGQKVRITRISRLLTQNELAELASVTQQDVSKLERNQRVRLDAREHILRVLGLIKSEGADVQ